MKVALIGAGNIALAHGPAIKAIKEAQIVGVCDMNSIRAQSTAEKLGANGFYTDAENDARRSTSGYCSYPHASSDSFRTEQIGYELWLQRTC